MDPNKYDHQTIDPKWQRYWETNKTFEAKNKGKKKYILDMFPYPSGDGLHVGHPRGYVASDIVAKYYQMKGFDVMHPVGFDAFGLPAENAAIKKGVHPAENTANNVVRFSEQLKSIGLGYDWSRVINTSDPEYYKWTQWLFLKLLENDLAYQKEAYVNWCPNDKTVLANEQVVGGCCERCGTEVVQQKRKQWFFRITAFTEDLIKDLDLVDFPEGTKEIQKNWIGKSEGADITFKVKDSDEEITVYTTRLDTLFGATYMVLAPEYENLDKFITDQQKATVEGYIKEASKKTELDRLADTKDKTGVFTGKYAINPANGEEIPIWVADYVLGSYGYGAVMAVPAHDERDFEFAKKFDLPIRKVVSGGELPYVGEGDLVNSEEFDGESSNTAFVAITKKVDGKITTKYRLRDWLVSRQRYWGAPIPVFYDKDDNPIPIEEKDLPVVLPTDVEFRPSGESPLETSKDFSEIPEKYIKKGAVRREFDTLDTFVCSSWYFLRYTDPNNDKEFAKKDKINYWMPIDLYVGGAEHSTGHLIFARFITKALQKFGYFEFSEPFAKLRHPGMVLGENNEKMSKSRGNVINPDDVIAGFGADALRMYEMFMGPFDQFIPWSTAGIEGVRKFLDRSYRVIRDNHKNEADEDQDLKEKFYDLVVKITKDTENMDFNTAVSAFMVFVNAAIEKEKVSSFWVEDFVKILAPYAPHLAEELWQDILAKKTSIWEESWPEAKKYKVEGRIITVVVQEAGKKRGEVNVKEGASQQDVVDLVDDDPKLEKLLEYKNRIYIQDRIINFY
ncbi:MAG: leucine--tRNA ligase [Patescibacteria group bacterium]|nr:leucine--tRNA ligase [Patescibacteria group bacterium]